MSDAYRYGFNGKENDDDVNGEGNQQDYGFRIYDPRVGRFLNVDPIANQYPELTPYQFAGNSPISSIDLDGLEGLVATGMPDASGRPIGMVITVGDAAKINRHIAVGTFKAVFSEPLPKKLIDHYANGGGTAYKLSLDEAKSLNAEKTGIMGLVPTDRGKYADLTKLVGYRDKGKRHIISGENYSIQGAANLGGTLGRFTIELQGTLTFDKKDKFKWTFEGKMRYVDIFDFETSPVGEGDLHRSDWGDFQTKFAKKLLPSYRI